jgi:hypothetical protein
MSGVDGMFIGKVGADDPNPDGNEGVDEDWESTSNGRLSSLVFATTRF